jgi:hypothetical protein
MSGARNASSGSVSVMSAPLSISAPENRAARRISSQEECPPRAGLAAGVEDHTHIEHLFYK